VRQSWRAFGYWARGYSAVAQDDEVSPFFEEIGRSLNDANFRRQCRTKMLQPFLGRNHERLWLLEKASRFGDGPFLGAAGLRAEFMDLMAAIENPAWF